MGANQSSRKKLGPTVKRVDGNTGKPHSQGGSDVLKQYDVTSKELVRGRYDPVAPGLVYTQKLLRSGLHTKPQEECVKQRDCSQEGAFRVLRSDKSFDFNSDMSLRLDPEEEQLLECFTGKCSRYLFPQQAKEELKEGNQGRQAESSALTRSKQTSDNTRNKTARNSGHVTNQVSSDVQGSELLSTYPQIENKVGNLKSLSCCSTNRFPLSNDIWRKEEEIKEEDTLSKGRPVNTPEGQHLVFETPKPRFQGLSPATPMEENKHLQAQKDSPSLTVDVLLDKIENSSHMKGEADRDEPFQHPMRSHELSMGQENRTHHLPQPDASSLELVLPTHDHHGKETLNGGMQFLVEANSVKVGEETCQDLPKSVLLTKEKETAAGKGENNFGSHQVSEKAFIKQSFNRSPMDVTTWLHSSPDEKSDNSSERPQKIEAALNQRVSNTDDVKGNLEACKQHQEDISTDERYSESGNMTAETSEAIFVTDTELSSWISNQNEMGKRQLPSTKSCGEKLGKILGQVGHGIWDTEWKDKIENTTSENGIDAKENAPNKRQDEVHTTPSWISFYSGSGARPKSGKWYGEQTSSGQLLEEIPQLDVPCKFVNTEETGAYTMLREQQDEVFERRSSLISSSSDCGIKQKTEKEYEKHFKKKSPIKTGQEITKIDRRHRKKNIKGAEERHEATKPNVLDPGALSKSKKRYGKKTSNEETLENNPQLDVPSKFVNTEETRPCAILRGQQDEIFERRSPIISSSYCEVKQKTGKEYDKHFKKKSPTQTGQEITKRNRRHRKKSREGAEKRHEATKPNVLDPGALSKSAERCGQRSRRTSCQSERETSKCEKNKKKIEESMNEDSQGTSKGHRNDRNGRRSSDTLDPGEIIDSEATIQSSNTCRDEKQHIGGPLRDSLSDPSVCNECIVRHIFPTPTDEEVVVSNLQYALGDSSLKKALHSGNQRGDVSGILPGITVDEKASNPLGRRGESSLTTTSPVDQYEIQFRQKCEESLALHRKKSEIITEYIDVKGKKGKGRQVKFLDLKVFEEIQVLKRKKEEFDGQSHEFTCFIENITEALSTIKMMPPLKIGVELTEVSRGFEREQRRLACALPIYAKKSFIVETVKANQVCIVIGETGSGKSTQMTQYLYEAGLAVDGQIVCTQPRKVAATSLADQVSKELGCKTGQLVGCLTGSYRKISAATKIIYTTDHALLMECIKDNNLGKFSCIIIDEAHERSINTDILLGMIKQALPRRPDLRVVITSATIDPELFKRFFGGCPIVKVSGRAFPVDVIWNQKQDTGVLSNTTNYVSEAVTKVIEIHRDEEKGDVLVFLTSPAEIDRACDELQRKVRPDEVICLPLHGKLQQEDQKKVFDPFPSKRKVVFSTNCAETSVTIPGIKFVVDTGRVKEMKYDDKRNLNILEVSIVSQSSAEQRKGRAGRMDSGKCFRLYTKDNFNAMEKGSRPEILRVHLGQAVLKLMELGISDPAKFDYVESPPVESIKCAMLTLIALGAVRDGKLTELGKNMGKIPLEPRLAKFLLDGINKGVGFESLILASVATVNGSVFFRMGTNDEKKEADTRKFEFCQPEGDFLTLLTVYREWWNEDPRDRNRWCFGKSLNAKALRMAEETLKDLKFTLKQELGMKAIQWKWSAFDEATTNQILQKTVYSCFLANLCVFTGHERAGYKIVFSGQYVMLHPSSALNFIGTNPHFLVYEKTLRTSQDFILNVTPIEESWLQDSITRGELQLDLEKLKAEVLVPVQINCSQQLKKMMLLPPKEKVKALEQRVSCACDNTTTVVDAKRDSGTIDVFVQRKHCATALDVVQGYLEEGRRSLRKETWEWPVHSESQGVRLVLERGCAVKQVLMPSMYRTVIARNIPEDIEPLEIIGSLSQFGALVEQKIWGRTVFATYENPEEAEEAVKMCGELDFKVEPNIPRQTQTTSDQGVSFDFKISWPRRRPSGRAVISFADQPDYYSLILNPYVRGCKPIKIRSSYAKLSSDKFRETSVFINNLDREATKLDIKTAVERNFPEVVLQDYTNQIFLHYERAEETTDAVIQGQFGVLQEELSNFAQPEDFRIMLNKPRKDSDLIARAVVKFRNPNEGVTAAKELNGKMILDLERWNVKIEVVCFLKSYITCPKYIYDVIKAEIVAKVSDISHNCYEMCGESVRVTQESAKSKGRVAVRVESQCMEHYVEATTVVTKETNGEKIDCTAIPHLKLILDRNGKEELRSIQKITGALIQPDERNMAVYLYGTREQKDNASDAIYAFVQELIISGSEIWEINLREAGRPRGLLKLMMSRFGRDLRGLSDLPEVNRVSMDLRMHVLKLHSTPKARSAVLAKVEEAAKDLPVAQTEARKPDDIDKSCPICMCEVERPSYRLASCGHEYCLSCVKDQLKAKEFPMTCAQENCEDVFTLKDLDTLLQGAEKEVLIREALECFVKSNQDKVHHCPSPDCPMVYCVTKDENPFRCSICSGVICTSCHDVYHVGLTCEENKMVKADDGTMLLERWMSKDPGNRKRCPNCKAPIEKNKGCNHITCSQCKAQLCWLCLKVFPTDGEVYAHQPYCRNNQGRNHALLF